MSAPFLFSTPAWAEGVAALSQVLSPYVALFESALAARTEVKLLKVFELGDSQRRKQDRKGKQTQSHQNVREREAVH